jgi:divalent metal cation (Fe/Co/Zn/Cd) transporter
MLLSVFHSSDLEDRSRESGKQLLEQEMRPYREIKRDVSAALATIPEITGTTHINTHWVPYKNGSGTVVDVAIVVQPDLKVGQAHEVAKRARK